MASLKDLASRVKEYLTPKTGGLATGVRNWASNTYVPTSQPVTQGLQNLSQRLGNVLTQVKKSPQELSPFTARQFIGGGQLPEAITQFRGAAMQPLSFGAIKNQEPEPTTKVGSVARFAGTIGGSIPAFMGAQNIVTGGINNFNRLPLVGKVASEAVVGALGVGATTAGNAKERLKEATKQFTPTNIAIGGIIPIAGSISQKKMVANVIKDSLPIKRALMDIQNLDILTQKNPTAWMQKVDNIEKLAQKTLPDVVNSRYMKEIKNSKPKEWFNHIGSAWRDRLEIATGQELPIGFQSKSIGGSKSIMEAEKLKGLTPEVTTKAIKTPQLGMQPETSTVLPKKISAELQTKPSPELQTVQIKGKASQQSQPFDSIIQEAKKQIGKTQEPKDQTFKQSLDNLYTQWVDRYNPIVKASKTTKEWLKTKGATLRPENDPEYLVRRLTGAGGIADYRFRTELDPVIKQAESLGIDKGDLDVYLANRRMAGFGQVGRDIYGADPKKSSQIVSALEGKYGENIKNIADQLYSYQNKGFQEMVDAGFISPESAKVIQSQNPDYSPLYRVMDEVDDYLGLPTRKTMQGSQPIAKIKGSTKQIESPLESVIGNTFRQRAAIEKNRVAQSIVDLQTITDLGFKKVPKSSPDTITVWRNGQKEYWNVGKDIAETAKGVNEEQMNVVLKVLQAPASLLRQGATGRNPEFMIPNIVRDQLDAGITSKYGYIPFVDYVSGLKSMLGNDDIYQKWQSSGAKIDLGELGGKKSISKLFDEKTAKKGLFNWLGEGLDFLGQYSEVPTRVGLFKKAYKKTGNELIAALESRDATVDFARMGSKMKVANSIIPFLNVGVQGFDKLVRSIKNNPSKLAFNMALYGATPAIATTLYNLQNHPEEYAEIPQYEKDDNFIIVKGRNENGNVNYIKIPKGNILPVISNPIENFLAFASGQDTQSIGKLSLNLFGDLLPVVESGGSVKEVLTKTIGSNIPQAFKPAAETLLNKSFYKYDPNKEQSKDIVPSYLQKREPYQQYYEWTPKLYQKIGALVNASPLKVQNLAEGYLAGFAKIPANIVEIMSKISRGEEVRPNEKPLIRRFFGETNPSSAKPAEKTPATPLMERITGKVGASETTPRVLSETQKESLKWKFKSSGQEAQQVADGMYFVKGSDGDANFIDISQEIPEPKYSGVESIDKKLKSQYKGDLTRRGNDIVKLYEKGQINEEQAKALLDEIEIKYDSTLAPKKPKKPKSIKIRSVKYSTPKLTKTARKSAPKISISTVKLPKSVKRNIVISKPKQISVKGFKNTLGASNRIA